MAIPDAAKANFLSRSAKVIRQRLRWSLLGNGRWRLQAKVVVLESKDVLKLYGAVGRKNFGFSLVYRNHYTIRKLNVHHRHVTPDGTVVIDQLHKHTWDKATRDRDCYIPSDIDGTGDINQILIAFLKEENITLTVPYQCRMLR